MSRPNVRDLPSGAREQDADCWLKESESPSTNGGQRDDEVEAAAPRPARVIPIDSGANSSNVKSDDMTGFEDASQQLAKAKELQERREHFERQFRERTYKPEAIYITNHTATRYPKKFPSKKVAFTPLELDVTDDNHSGGTRIKYKNTSSYLNSDSIPKPFTWRGPAGSIFGTGPQLPKDSCWRKADPFPHIAGPTSDLSSGDDDKDPELLLTPTSSTMSATENPQSTTPDDNETFADRKARVLEETDKLSRATARLSHKVARMTALIKEREKKRITTLAELQEWEELLAIRQDRITTKSYSLHAEAEELDARSEQLDTRARELDVNCREAEAVSRELDRRSQELAAQTQKLSITSQEIKAQELAAKIWQTELEDRESTLKNRESALKDRELKLNNRESNLFKRERACEENEHNVITQLRQCEEQKANNIEEVPERKEQENEHVKQEGKFQAITNSLDERKADIDARLKEVENKDHHLQHEQEAYEGNATDLDQRKAAANSHLHTLKKWDSGPMRRQANTRKPENLVGYREFDVKDRGNSMVERQHNVQHEQCRQS